MGLFVLLYCPAMGKSGSYISPYGLVYLESKADDHEYNCSDKRKGKEEWLSSPTFGQLSACFHLSIYSLRTQVTLLWAVFWSADASCFPFFSHVIFLSLLSRTRFFLFFSFPGGADPGAKSLFSVVLWNGFLGATPKRLSVLFSPHTTLILYYRPDSVYLLYTNRQSGGRYSLLP